MATTYTLVCDDCKEQYWIGQASSQCPFNIYSSEDTSAFLHKHCGHSLRMVNDFVDESTAEYKEIFHPAKEYNINEEALDKLSDEERELLGL